MQYTDTRHTPWLNKILKEIEYHMISERSVDQTTEEQNMVLRPIFREYLTNSEYFVYTKEDYTKAFANRVLDSQEDQEEIGDNTLSLIPMRSEGRVIRLVRSSQVKRGQLTYHFDLYVYQVIYNEGDTYPFQTFLIYNIMGFNLHTQVRGDEYLQTLVRHGMLSIDWCRHNDGLVDPTCPKWSYSPARIVSSGIFTWVGKGLVTYNSAGQKIEINRKSSLYSMVKPGESAMIRYYYSRRISKMDRVYAYGSLLRPIEVNDMQEFMDLNGLDKSAAIEIETKNGTKFLGAIYPIDCRAVIRTQEGFSTFVISDKFRDHCVKSMNHVII